MWRQQLVFLLFLVLLFLFKIYLIIKNAESYKKIFSNKKHFFYKMKILFISGLNEKEGRLNDFMHDIVLHGLREIYGDSVIDYPGVWYMYRDEVKKRNYDINNLWGKGFTLYNLLSNYQQINTTYI